jgi:2-amino-4-hydroxy-6-hydroxymethyldihydropteridine diphosphokinase
MEVVDDSRENSALTSPGPAHPVVIGIGSNQGDGVALTAEAVHLVGELAPLCGISGLYRTAPVGGPVQADFLNAAVLVDYSGSLHTLLPELQALESACGRVRTVRWGPRTLDLDILWAGSRVEATSSLTVPHPELTRRAFALRPLLDVVSDACEPGSGLAYAGIFERLAGQKIQLVAAQNWWKRSLE